VETTKSSITRPSPEAHVELPLGPGRVVGGHGIRLAREGDLELLGPVDGPRVQGEPRLVHGRGGARLGTHESAM